MPNAASSSSIRLRLAIRGLVQGVGFRPTVYRLAQDLGLSGWVRNDPRGVTLEIEGPRVAVLEFEPRLRGELEPPARIDGITTESASSLGSTHFEILASDDTGNIETTLLADIAPCGDCRREFSNPLDRRYRYPFTNCTHCGPRFTIIRAVPYDRPNTTMAEFVMCDECQREYDDPANRRFHAQPNACPACGPRIALQGQDVLAVGEDALSAAVESLRSGAIVALQGIGGFQLLVDARSQTAVERLRERKHRWEKPFAVMVPDLSAAQALAEIDAAEAALLVSPEAPIVLVRRRREAPLAEAVAPSNPYIGVMLPSSPLHHLLMANLGIPIVATSGNLSEEPICITPEEARQRLGSIADRLLSHDRPIARHADDSVAMVVDGSPQLLRRARGFAPLPVSLGQRGPVVLALGGHVKSTIGLSVGDRCFISQHIGDLDNAETRAAFLAVIADFLRIYAVRPTLVAHDLHPDYASSQLAEQLTAASGMLAGVPSIAVQHHHAHLAGCLADCGTDEPALGLLWDGSGLGSDRTLWGGEFLFGNSCGYERIACLSPFLLPGGDRSSRSPRRIAAALLYQCFGPTIFDRQEIPSILALSESERRVLRRQLEKRVLSPQTSSIGRLFDAAASLLGLRHETAFEGQAAMTVEFAADPYERGSYPLELVERTLASSDSVVPCPKTNAVAESGFFNPSRTPRFYLDPSSLLEGMLTDLRQGVDRARVAARFHGSLVDAAVSVARRVGVGTVALSGGCFQNRLLLQRCRQALETHGHRVLVHQQVPTNDGGLALGQVAVARSSLKVT